MKLVNLTTQRTMYCFLIYYTSFVLAAATPAAELADANAELAYVPAEFAVMNPELAYELAELLSAKSKQSINNTIVLG